MSTSKTRIDLSALSSMLVTSIPRIIIIIIIIDCLFFTPVLISSDKKAMVWFSIKKKQQFTE